jgi:hypothetical protein
MPVSGALLNAAAASDLCHNWISTETAAIHRMNLLATNLWLNEEFAACGLRSLAELLGRAPLPSSLICGIVKSEIVRLENCSNIWRDNADRSATVGRA